jgi:crotonobetainyl-CoA:carnitine CoA-transferase CaiB-like acyl-CoA transferase
MVLEGIKVVEMATYMAGPGAAGIMADWGASVIKVEAPRGDPSRHWIDNTPNADNFNPVFDFDNRGKRSIIVDIRTEGGAAIMHRLLAQADVFVTNSRPGPLKRAGLDYETLARRYPKLVFGSITGYGLEGPEADRAAMDIAAFWARSGLLSMFTPKEYEPQMPRMAFGDHVTSLALLSGIMGGLVARERTGKGRLVEASLLRTAYYAAGSEVAIQLALGRLASTRPRKRAVSPLVNFFKTKDGRWFVTLQKAERNEWSILCDAVERPDLKADARFSSNKARKENQEAMIDALDAAFATKTLAEIAPVFDAHDMVWSPVEPLAEALADPQTIANGAIIEATAPTGNLIKAPAGPIRFSGDVEAPRRPSPRFGEHTRAILAEAGYDAEKIEALIAQGAAAESGETYGYDGRRRAEV